MIWNGLKKEWKFIGGREDLYGGREDLYGGGEGLYGEREDLKVGCGGLVPTQSP